MPENMSTERNREYRSNSTVLGQEQVRHSGEEIGRRCVEKLATNPAYRRAAVEHSFAGFTDSNETAIVYTDKGRNMAVRFNIAQNYEQSFSIRCESGQQVTELAVLMKGEGQMQDVLRVTQWDMRNEFLKNTETNTTSAVEKAEKFTLLL